MLISRQSQKLTQQHNPPDRRLYLFFSGRNCQNRAPNRQKVDQKPCSRKNQTLTQHNKTTGKKVPPAHAKRVYSFTWSNPVRVASPHRINLEEPGQGGQPTGLTWRNPVRVASPRRIKLFTWRNPVRVASPHRINLEEPGQGGQPI